MENSTEKKVKELEQKADFLNEKEQKLKVFADKLKLGADKLKLEKENYKQEIHSQFDNLLAKSIQEKQAELDKIIAQNLEKQAKLNKELEKVKNKEAEFKIQQDNIEAQKQKLDNKYKQELEDSKRKQLIEHETMLNEKLQNEVNKQRENLEKQKLELENKKADLENKKLAIDNEKTEIENTFKAQLLESNRKLELEYQEKLEQEFNENFRDRVKELKENENTLEREKEEFETEKITLNAKLDSTIREYEKLLSEYNEIKEQLNENEVYTDRDLIRENEQLKQERENLKNRLETEKKEMQEKISSIQKDSKEIEKIYQEQLDKIESYNALELKCNDLEHKNENLQERLKEQEYYQNQVKILQERLDHLQNQFIGKEKQREIQQVIKQEYILDRILNDDNKINENDEIKWLENIESNMETYGVKYTKRLLYAFHTDLKCAFMSPLSVLSGVSGTGKSELPKLYAHFGGFNFLSEAVQPTWDSPASMVGFYNMIENKFDSTNILKFLVQTSISKDSKDENAYGLKESMNLILLDELNLAHIELYFAEFLSKFEIKRGSKNINLDIHIGSGMNMPITLDSNLLWVGTMNEDETTKSLSDKVLDRAFCLNFPRPNELKSRPKLKMLDEIQSFKWLPKSTWEGWIIKEISSKEIESKLENYRKITESINKELAKAHRAIGHRVWQSMESYMINYPCIIENEEKRLQTAFEDQLAQKVMPKLRGIELHGKEGEALLEIQNIITEKVPNLAQDFEYAMSNPYGQFKFDSAQYLDIDKE